jgi:hypothetical protein
MYSFPATNISNGKKNKQKEKFILVMEYSIVE